MTEPKRYTLDEARRELAKLRCAMNGHSWQVMETDARPIALVCRECGDQWAVREKTE